MKCYHLTSQTNIYGVQCTWCTLNNFGRRPYMFFLYVVYFQYFCVPRTCWCQVKLTNSNSAPFQDPITLFISSYSSSSFVSKKIGMCMTVCKSRQPTYWITNLGGNLCAVFQIHQHSAISLYLVLRLQHTYSKKLFFCCNNKTFWQWKFLKLKYSIHSKERQGTLYQDLRAWRPPPPSPPPWTK